MDLLNGHPDPVGEHALRHAERNAAFAQPLRNEAIHLPLELAIDVLEPRPLPGRQILIRVQTDDRAVDRGLAGRRFLQFWSFPWRSRCQSPGHGISSYCLAGADGMPPPTES